MTAFESYREAPLRRSVRASATIPTTGPGLVSLDRAVADFLARAGASDGLLVLFCRHTSASLVIQENASPEVRDDLVAALDRLAPEGAGWRHDAEGPDDMPAHVKAMLTGASLHLPVVGGRAHVGAWQGVFLVEHRRRPHRRTVDFLYVGA